MIKRCLLFLSIIFTLLNCDTSGPAIQSPMEVGSNCQLILIEEVDFNGDPTSQTSFKYDNRGRIDAVTFDFRTTTFRYTDDLLVEICTRDSYNGEDFCEQFAYYPDNRLKSVKSFLGTRDGVPVWIISNYYHFADSIVVRDSLGVTQSKYFMNSNGRPDRLESYDELYGLTSWAEYKYDADGNQTEQRSWFWLRGRVVQISTTYNTAFRHLNDRYWLQVIIQNLLFAQNAHAISSITSTGGTVNSKEDYRYETVSSELVAVYRKIEYLDGSNSVPEDHLWKRYQFECN